MITRCMRILAVAALALALPAAAHHSATPDAVKVAPGPNAQAAVLAGIVDRIVVANQVTGTSHNFAIFVANDGRHFTLSGPGADGLLPGDSIVTSGKTDGPACCFRTRSTSRRPPRRARWRCRRCHGRGHAATRARRQLRRHAERILLRGRRRTTAGTRASRWPRCSAYSKTACAFRCSGNAAGAGENDGQPNRYPGAGGAEGRDRRPCPRRAPVTTATSSCRSSSRPVEPGHATHGSTAPIRSRPPRSRGAVFGPTPTSNVKAYYNEMSYGQQLLSGTVADNGSGDFLLANVAKPATCDISVIATAAETAATARGYNSRATPASSTSSTTYPAAAGRAWPTSAGRAPTRTTRPTCS